MPTRKQRRRMQKERRHEYETVWVDEEGNELEEPPEELVAATPDKRGASKPAAKAKATQQRGGRQVRVPPPPSWQRSAKRALIIGVLIFVFIDITRHNVVAALVTAVLYTLLFIPFQFTLDRFGYKRWQRRAEQQGQKGSAGKR